MLDTMENATEARESLIGKLYDLKNAVLNSADGVSDSVELVEIADAAAVVGTAIELLEMGIGVEGVRARMKLILAADDPVDSRDGAYAVLTIIGMEQPLA